MIAVIVGGRGWAWVLMGWLGGWVDWVVGGCAWVCVGVRGCACAWVCVCVGVGVRVRWWARVGACDARVFLFAPHARGTLRRGCAGPCSCNSSWCVYLCIYVIRIYVEYKISI